MNDNSKRSAEVLIQHFGGLMDGQAADTQELFDSFLPIQDFVKAVVDTMSGDSGALGRFLGTWLDSIDWLNVENWAFEVPGLDLLQRIVNQVMDILNGLIVTPINSAVAGIKDWFSDLLNWRTRTATDVDSIADNINNAVTEGGTKTGTGKIGDVFDRMAGLFGLAGNAQRIAVAAQQQLQELQNESNQPGFEGFSWSTQFSGSDGSPISNTDFLGSPELVIRGSYGYVGISESAPEGTYYRVANYAFASDVQSAAIVLGNRTGNLYSGVAVACDANGTQGAYLRANDDRFEIGRFTRSGSSWQFIPWTGDTKPPSEGDSLRLRRAGHNYYVLRNGTVVLSWTDTGASVPQGDMYRRAMFFEQKGFNVFGGPIASRRLAGFAMADWPAPGGTVTVPSWQLVRNSASAVALTVGHGAQAMMPDGFYTLIDQSHDVTVNLQTGAITINTTGLYEIYATSINRDDNDSSGLNNNNGNTVNAWRASPWVLYVDGVGKAGPIQSGGVIPVFLTAGQVVRVGVSASVPNYPSMRGGGETSTDVPATSNITHVGGASATFFGRKLAS
ncbi:minor tail protein [Gordonia phage Mollymur]|uniref:Minor tail protein n=1 Tax=Gordonia phage Mollymur TaxID=2590895 RepID=A0A4Y6EKP9_9CAUD|nr:minor tail protein [Gordonia phage Mollymur]QDF15399.1 minor tail protein [Gordonia phage Mollymur]